MKSNTETLCLTVTGPSGCGKSTLMQTLQGVVALNGYSMWNVTKFTRLSDVEVRHVIKECKPTITFHEEDGMERLATMLAVRKKNSP